MKKHIDRIVCKVTGHDPVIVTTSAQKWKEQKKALMEGSVAIIDVTSHEYLCRRCGDSL